MKKLWFIRHGQSTSNAGAVTTDPGSTPLTTIGREQAEHVAQAFTQAPDLIITSPYIRTKQTAAPLRERYPDVPHEEWQIFELGYIAPEKYAGTTGRDRVQWIREFMLNPDPDFKDGNDAESFRDMIGRVEIMRQKIIESDAQSIAIFTHGAFLRVFLWQFLLGSARASDKKEHFGPFLLAVSIPNCCIINGLLTEDELLLGKISIDHLPTELNTRYP